MAKKLNVIERTVADWYDNFPKLPNASRRWLYENVWWIIAISVVFGLFGILSTLKDESFSGHSLFGIMDDTAVTVSLLIAILIVIINASAISSLKNKYKLGWNLLFMSLLLMAVSVAVEVVLTFDVGDFLSGSLMTLLFGYVLFSFRDKYVVHSIKSGAKKSSRK